MENKPQKSVYDRLDSIETSQSITQAQNQQIIDLLNNLSKQQTDNQNVVVNNQPQQQVSNQQILRDFVKSSKKIHVWFGTHAEFNKAKIIFNILVIALIGVGVISTILTSIAFKLYSTFTLFENIWLVFACILLSYSFKLKKRMVDSDLMYHSNTIFIRDQDGTWRDTNQEKKRFRWFRRISYIAVIANIISIWIFSSGAIAAFATIFELMFAGLTIGIFFATANMYCMYGTFILFVGKNLLTGQEVTLIFDVFGKKLAPYDEYKEKMKDYL